MINFLIYNLIKRNKLISIRIRNSFIKLQLKLNFISLFLIYIFSVYRRVSIPNKRVLRYPKLQQLNVTKYLFTISSYDAALNSS